MKTLRLLLIFLGFLTLGVLVALFLSPKSISYKTGVEVELPTSEVWSAYTDAGFMPYWIESLDTAYYTTEGAPGEGSVIALKYDQGDHAVEVQEVVKTWLEEQLLVTHTIVDDLMEVNNEVRFEQLETNRTRIKFQSEVNALSWLMRFSLWGSEESMEERSDQRLRKFAEMIELRNSG